MNSLYLKKFPPKMSELMKWFASEMESPTGSIASFLAELHHRFVLIHPFDDGNGSCSAHVDKLCPDEARVSASRH